MWTRVERPPSPHVNALVRGAFSLSQPLSPLAARRLVCLFSTRIGYSLDSSPEAFCHSLPLDHVAAAAAEHPDRYMHACMHACV